MTYKICICLIVLVALASSIYGAANCPAQEEYYKCSLEKCFKTCKDAKSPPPCPSIASGCFQPSCECKGGQLRDDLGVCVEYEQCFLEQANKTP